MDTYVFAPTGKCKDSRRVAKATIHMLVGDCRSIGGEILGDVTNYRAWTTCMLDMCRAGQGNIYFPYYHSRQSVL